MKIDRESREKMRNLPPLLQMAARALLDALQRIIDGDCDEDAVSQSLSTLNANSMGKYGSEDLLTYDKAMKVLGISDRNRLKRFLDSKGIKQVIIHNQKVGFRRSDILSVKNCMNNGENTATV